MICDKCGRNSAVFSVRVVTPAGAVRMNLCRDCANGPEFSGELLSDLLAGDPDSISVLTDRVVRCETCGMSFEEISNAGRVGCSDCYRTFADRLTRELEKKHGEASYKGFLSEESEPAPSEEARPDLTGLREQLAAAIAEENFELAAEIRDEIRRREEGKEQ